MDLPEIILVNVLARFPLKNIARFRLLSKNMKSLLDSTYFRDYYISFNSSSSLSWSIIPTKPHKLSLEIISHYKCKTWGLTRSPGSFLSFLVDTPITKLLVLSCTDGLVLVYAEAIDGSPLYYVGNPLFQEWFLIPLPEFLTLQELNKIRVSERFTDTGLVTKIENGVVVSYKVVWMLRLGDNVDFIVYSSETGVWEMKNVKCGCLCATVSSRYDKSISLNGILHWLSQASEARDGRFVVAYDFFGGGDGDECRVVRFPKKYDELRRFRRTFTTSEGSVVYFNEFCEGGSRTLRVWKMVGYVNGPEAWELVWEIDLMTLIGGYSYDFPVVMHPLKSEIIYLWSRYNNSLIVFNMRTLVVKRHKESSYETESMDGCVVSFNGCREYMEGTFGCYVQINQSTPNHLFFSQYVLPRWMQRLPRPKPA